MTQGIHYTLRERLEMSRTDVLKTGIADNKFSGYMVDISMPLALMGDSHDPSSTWTRLATYWGGYLAGSTRDRGRIQYCYSFRTYAELLAFTEEWKEAAFETGMLVSAIYRIDAAYLYCVNPDEPVDSFIDLNPLPLP